MNYVWAQAFSHRFVSKKMNVSFEEDSVCQSLLANEYQFELKYIFRDRDRDRDRDRGPRTMTVAMTVDLGP
jgi:hypothetical protein